MKSTSVTVTKVERKQIDGIRLKPKCYIMGNQQPSSEQEKVQRLSREGVGLQTTGSSK